MAGVVVVAALAVAIPALASGHDRAAVHAAAARALLCPGPSAPGSRQLFFVAPTTHAKSRHGGRRAGHAHNRGAHSRGTPAIRCIPPCGWIVTEPAGATGRAMLTPPLTCEPRLRCVIAGADRARVFCQPIPCILKHAHGNGAATGAAPRTGARLRCPTIPCPVPSLKAPSGATGATVLCPPVPCPLPYLEPSGSTAPTTGATVLCPPIPCLIPNAETRGQATGTTGAIACPLPPVCPLAGTAGASVCPAPCVYAGVSAPTGQTGSTATCPPIPVCPPEPRTTAASTLPGLYACPEIAAGSTAGG
jgi:hypothetical protein